MRRIKRPGRCIADLFKVAPRSHAAIVAAMRPISTIFAISSGPEPAILRAMRPQMTTRWNGSHARSTKRAPASAFALAVALFLPAAVALPATITNATAAAPEAASPSKPREFFNAGTRELSAGKLREAEAYLETALASQNERLQTPALYNLGHVRFEQGIEELKKGPSCQSAVMASRAAEQQGDEALQAAEAALESNDVQKMV